MEMIDQRIVHVTGSTIEPYDVRIGEGVMGQLAQVLGSKPAKVALIHTQPVQRHSDRARTLLRQAGYDAYDIVIPDAEAGKTIEVANGIWQRLGDEGFTRSDAIVGLGGGAATDLAGFVAATWMRGIRYVNCPTSLLAMVDASTGGKTGINTPQGKNLVGSFYTPAGVLADLKSLASLPNDIFIEGLGEVAKSGFIMDPEILQILEDHAGELRAFDGSTFLDSGLKDVVAELIEHTVSVKATMCPLTLKRRDCANSSTMGIRSVMPSRSLSISAGVMVMRWRSVACMRPNCRIFWGTSIRISWTIIVRCWDLWGCLRPGTMAHGMMCSH